MLGEYTGCWRTHIQGVPMERHVKKLSFAPALSHLSFNSCTLPPLFNSVTLLSAHFNGPFTFY
jgi:hypothetical protein